MKKTSHQGDYVRVILILSFIYICWSDLTAEEFGKTQKGSNKIINLEEYEQRSYSQNGEDGVIDAIFHFIGVKNKYYVEFGVEDASESNTRFLRESKEWSGLLMDGGYENDLINLHKEFITADNINSLFVKYNVPLEFDLLSIDIDFNDFYVWYAINNKYRPRVVVIEYNATHLPYEDKVIVYDPFGHWDITNYFGASILSMYKLGRSKGYSLVYAEKMGVNLFFIRNDIIKQLAKKGISFLNVNNVSLIYRLPRYGTGPNGGHNEDYKKRSFISSEEILKK